MKRWHHAIKRNTPEQTFLSNYKNKNKGANMLGKTIRNCLDQERNFSDLMNNSLCRMFLFPGVNFVLKDLSHSCHSFRRSWNII